MMKKLCLIIIEILCILSTVSFASGIDVVEKPIPGLEGPASVVLGMIQWIGFVVGIGMVIWIGVKYITAGAGGRASAEDAGHFPESDRTPAAGIPQRADRLHAASAAAGL